MLGKEVYCFGRAHCTGSYTPNLMAAVGLKGRANVPAVHAMGSIGATAGRLLMDNSLGAWWGKGVIVVAEDSIDLGMGRQFGIDSRSPEEVEGQFCSWNKTVPEMEWEVGVSAAEACNEVIFEGANGAFSRVAAMDAGRGQLEVDICFVEEVFEGLGAFIVEALEVGFESCFSKAAVHSFIGGNNAGGLSVFEGLSKDVVAVVVIKDEDVEVASAGGDWKLSSLVSMCLTRVGDQGSKAVVGAALRFIIGEEVREEFCFKAWWNGAGRLGAALVLAGLIKVPFGCGN